MPMSPSNYPPGVTGNEPEIAGYPNEEDLVNGYCEDYPACGHTPQDPCSRQWYDEPDAFDTRKHPHALCNHEEGECMVDPEDGGW